jgi:hypothetical protein
LPPRLILIGFAERRSQPIRLMPIRAAGFGRLPARLQSIRAAAGSFRPLTGGLPFIIRPANGLINRLINRLIAGIAHGRRAT